MPKRRAMAANPPEYELRENWLPAVAAALTVADVGYRAVRDRKKKKKDKKKENPRYLDERGGMKRGLADLRGEARNRLATANKLGTEKGNLLVELSRVPRTDRKTHQAKRTSLDRRIDHVEHLFYMLKSQVQDEIDINYYGRLSREQSIGLRALQREYRNAAQNVQDAAKRKSAARKARKSKANPKAYAGISGIGYYWATVRSAKPGDYIAPMILEDRDPATGKKVYYFVFESKNKRRITALEQAARGAGLRSTSMRNELEGSYKQRKRGQEPLHIYKTGSLKRVQQLAILLNSRNIGYKVDPPALFGKLARSSMPAPKARKPTGLEHKSMAELAARRKELLAKRAKKKKANPPRRKNFVGSLVRGGVALAKTKMGKAIIAETAVVAAVMIGDKLVQKGKISPKVMSYVQGRVEQKTGVKPSKAEVTKVLSAMDKNKDKTLTDAEVIEALELIQKGQEEMSASRHHDFRPSHYRSHQGGSSSCPMYFTYLNRANAAASRANHYRRVGDRRRMVVWQRQAQQFRSLAQVEHAKCHSPGGYGAMYGAYGGCGHCGDSHAYGGWVWNFLADRSERSRQEDVHLGEENKEV